MSSDLETILGDSPVPETEVAADEAAAATPNPEGDPSGATPAEDAEPAEDTPQGWQYAAYKDEKTKRQELETKYEQTAREAAELKAWRDQVLEQQQQHQQRQHGNDPNFVAQQFDARLQQVETQSRLNMSEALAVRDHGADKVKEAKEAFYASQATDPAGFQVRFEQFGTGPDPVGDIVKWHQQQSLVTEIGGDPDAYKEKLKAELLAEMQANGAVPLQGNTPSPSPTGNLPSDFSQTRNVGSRTGSNWSGPTPLEQVLKD